MAANIKSLIVDAQSSGFTVYALIRRESDQNFLDNSTGFFALTPSSYYISMTEDTILRGRYQLIESRSVWINGEYTIRAYRQVGGSPNPSADTGLSTDSFWISGDTIAELESPITSFNPVVVEAPPAIVTYNVQDLINTSFRLIGVIGPGTTTATSMDLSKALTTLNMMIDSWSADGLATRAYIPEGFILPSNVSSVTIGIGQTFNTTTPIEIISAFYRDLNNNDFPIEVIDRLKYDMYSDKITTPGHPQSISFDPGLTQQSINIGTIFIYPKTDSNTYTLYIQSLKNLSAFNNLSDPVTFPPHYIRALVYNLAIELSLIYPGLPPNIGLEKIAYDSLQIVERRNGKILTMFTDLPVSSGGYNIYSDSFGS